MNDHTAPQARLLIVDDETAQMKALCQTLRDEGYETIGYTSSRAALEALSAGKFDIVLTDLMMPHMNGIALLSACRQIDPNLVGIVMTGHGAIETAVQAMQAGALDYIQKPFKLRHILPVLSRAATVGRLRRANAELEERIRERSVELERANKELESFSYSVSHDLRAPLRIVSGYANLLAEECREQLSEPGVKALDAIQAGAKRMNELITDLLELSKWSRCALTLADVDTSALVREVVNELSRDVGERAAHVHATKLPNCRADGSLLKQVFFNLLSNALKFTAHREQPRVIVAGRREPEEIVFSVSDNGAGFDMAAAEKLFHAFQRLHSSDNFEGTGIGLSIVQRIVTRHGGRVWAEGVPEQGATFFFALPITADTGAQFAKGSQGATNHE